MRIGARLQISTNNYLEELVALTESQYADAAFMSNLSEKYDIFER